MAIIRGAAVAALLDMNVIAFVEDFRARTEIAAKL
tara:strand:+ start:3361 stop:3465 length:105 start_codon:yes stop_codon:yes gene_type:complete